MRHKRGFDLEIGNTNADLVTGGAFATDTGWTKGTGWSIGNAVTAVAIVAGGTGYTAGDDLTVAGGTGTAATLDVTTVALGVITAVTVLTSGTYTVNPTNPVSVTGGTGGDDATFNLTLSSNVGIKLAGTASDLEQAIASLAAAKTYRLTYTITRTAGTLTPQLGGVNGTERSAAGTYTEFITTTGTENLKFQADATYAGTVDNVTLYIDIKYCALYLPFYKMGSEAPVIYDYSGNNKHATITGAVPSATSPGWYCDGSNDLFTLSNIFTTNQTGLTILSWVYCHAFDMPVATASKNAIYSNAAGVGNNRFMLVHQHDTDNTNKWKLTIGDGAISTILVTASLSDANFNTAYQNKWLCVCSTFEASTRMKLWINGSAAIADKTASVPAQCVPNTANTDSIGYSLSDAAYANFTYGETGILNKPFTDIELRNYYELSRRRYGV